MKGSDWLGANVNPAVFTYNGRLLMTTGLSRSYDPATLNRVLFVWIDHAKFPLDPEKGNLLCLDWDASAPLHVLPYVFGQDPRVVYAEEEGGGRMELYVTNPFSTRNRMGMIELALNKSSGCLEVTRYYMTIHPLKESQGQNHKNWTPFRYRNETLLLQSINPMVVVKVKPISEVGNGEMQAHMESKSPLMHIDWAFGTLRGGTNAIFLPQYGVYLSFFHSVGHVGGNFIKTYFTGAYTFSAEPPFHLLQTSPLPIMPQRFYEGAWLRFKNAQVDYVMFPIHIFQHGTEIVMSLGGQDKDGYLAWFDLEEVLDSLVDVKPKGAYAHGAA
mmetsp:Transcript_8520/g.18720  ORF Transcript_8520/g.18720 Transcript_8520/m.18720 type:complete len:329 (-) Transcript_8520:205-1191(-)